MMQIELSEIRARNFRNIVLLNSICPRTVHGWKICKILLCWMIHSSKPPQVCQFTKIETHRAGIRQNNYTQRCFDWS
ncbi:unnamed protein product [Caenorhabditis angaria]|uniref:Uncharacterized protein n=1 Tax=Caenorhabditis angaria TaxID=860376 RepID=A0A9P1N9I3_9PELO|nr:unnamed protein product [Caenorhabditis angaria]